MKTRVIYFLVALLLAVALFIVRPAHAQDQGNRRLGNVVITNNATAAGQCPETTTATTGAWQTCSGGGGGSNPSFVTPISYSSLAVCSSQSYIAWVSGVPGGACRAHWPVVSAGGPWISDAVAIKASGASTPVIVGSSIGPDGVTNTSVNITLPTFSNGNLFVMFAASFTNPINTPSGWTFVGNQFLAGFGSGFYLGLYMKVASGDTSPLTIGGSSVNNIAAVIYSLSGASSSLTPDGNAFNSGNGVSPATAALSGLSGSNDLFLAAFSPDGGTTNGFTPPGSLTKDQQNGGANGNALGTWTGHMTLSGTSQAALTGSLQVGGGPYTCWVTCDGASHLAETGY